MGAIAKTITGAFAAAGLLSFSQLPEFAQQYSQRLGGAINELRVIVADFDRDAANSQLTRDEALEQMLGSPTQFARDRGASMNRTITRYYLLSRQSDEMERGRSAAAPALHAANTRCDAGGRRVERFQAGAAGDDARRCVWRRRAR